MTQHEYEVYRKTHGYAHPLEVERGKIRHEKTDYARYRRRSQEKMKHRLRELVRSGDLDAWDEEVQLDEDEARAARELGNARAHGQRLRKLEAYENESLQSDQDTSEPEPQE
jgi:hypothetical protein